MKTMRLDDGDFVIGSSSDYQMLVKTPKVEQDLRCALIEPLGNDRFHPGWGSSLTEFIAQPLDPALELTVTTEVNRVLGNYAAVQRDKIEADMYSNAETRFTTEEVLASVLGVKTTTDRDGLRIQIGVATASGDVVTVDEVTA